MKLTIPPKWGIRVFAAWALILTILALANLLLLTAFVEVGSEPLASQTRIWLTFVFNVFFSLGFGGSYRWKFIEVTQSFNYGAIIRATII